MRKIFSLLFSITLTAPSLVHADSLYVFFRHGEKPDNDSGQLTCKGLNRALNLPPVLFKRYGQPDKLYASAPYQNKTGSSLRPLLTLMPMATLVSKPIIQSYHAEQTGKLVSAMLRETKPTVTYISWEHKNLVNAARKLVMRTGGSSLRIPAWDPDDFDTIYIIRLDNMHRFKSFIVEREELNGLPDLCPSGMNATMTMGNR